MTDILIEWRPDLLEGDWTIARGGLAVSQTGSDDLKSAVLVSLFTWGVAPVGYVSPSGDTDPRGWWGDTYETSPIGSLLWTLFRAKKSDGKALLQQAKSFCLVSLEWLKTDGVAKTIEVTTFWFTPTAMGITIAITKPSGQTFGYAWTWKGF